MLGYILQFVAFIHFLPFSSNKIYGETIYCLSKCCFRFISLKWSWYLPLSFTITFSYVNVVMNLFVVHICSIYLIESLHTGGAISIHPFISRSANWIFLGKKLLRFWLTPVFKRIRCKRSLCSLFTDDFR